MDEDERSGRVGDQRPPDGTERRNRQIADQAGAPAPAPVNAFQRSPDMRRQLNLDVDRLPPVLEVNIDRGHIEKMRREAYSLERTYDGSKWLFQFLPPKIAMQYMAELDDTMPITIRQQRAANAVMRRRQSTRMLIVDYYWKELKSILLCWRKD